EPVARRREGEVIALAPEGAQHIQRRKNLRQAAARHAGELTQITEERVPTLVDDEREETEDITGSRSKDEANARIQQIQPQRAAPEQAGPRLLRGPVRGVDCYRGAA